MQMTRQLAKMGRRRWLIASLFLNGNRRGLEPVPNFHASLIAVECIYRQIRGVARALIKNSNGPALKKACAKPDVIAVGSVFPGDHDRTAPRGNIARVRAAG